MTVRAGNTSAHSMKDSSVSRNRSCLEHDVMDKEYLLLKIFRQLIVYAIKQLMDSDNGN
jgi:hypothetical protein